MERRKPTFIYDVHQPVVNMMYDSRPIETARPAQERSKYEYEPSPPPAPLEPRSYPTNMVWDPSGTKIVGSQQISSEALDDKR